MPFLDSGQECIFALSGLACIHCYAPIPMSLRIVLVFQQVGASCGYIAAMVVSTLLNRRDDGGWLNQADCCQHTELGVIREGNSILGINNAKPSEASYLAESQVEQLLLHHVRQSEAHQPIPLRGMSQTEELRSRYSTEVLSLDLFVRNFANCIGHARSNASPLPWQACMPSPRIIRKV